MRCERDDITGGGRAMSKLIRVFEAAMRDARRSEAMRYDETARRALRTDPESALLAFELRAGGIGDETGEREERMMRRDRGVRAGRRTRRPPGPRSRHARANRRPRHSRSCRFHPRRTTP